MKKFSAGYTYLNPNFIIDNLGCEISSDKRALFRVAMNILTRGCPTRPSPFIKEKYSTSLKDYAYSFNNIVYVKKTNIKGGNNKNPAFAFFEELKKNNKANKFITNSFISECDMRDVCLNYNNEGYLDFYSPILNLCIEVDGIQHEEVSQKIKDKERDDLLLSKGIVVKRIKVNQNKNISDIVENQQNVIEEITNFFNKYKENKKLNFINPKLVKEDDKNLACIIRFQILLLHIICSENIPKEILINVKTDEFSDKNVFEFAKKDLLTLCNNICNIMNISNLSNNIIIYLNENIKVSHYDVDFSIFKLWDSVLNNKGNIIVRNDYFPYDIKSNVDDKIYVSNKNYYQVNICDFNYKITNYNDEKIIKSLEYFLKLFFNKDFFRGKQVNFILDTLNNICTIGLFPTGFGKSLCYQFAALLIPRYTLIISPLKSLMNDQIIDLRNYNINCVCILNSDSDNKNNKRFVESKNSQIIYVSPERFLIKKDRDFFEKISGKFKLLVIDEVHCLSEWGHDFRTSYLCLLNILKKNVFKNNKVTLVGLTATASSSVLNDIVSEFYKFSGYEPRKIISDNMTRAEISYEIIEIQRNNSKDLKYTEGFKKLKDILKKSKKTVVFVAYKSVAKYLFNQDYEGYKKDYFIGNSDDANNNTTKLEKFKIAGNDNILFATKAFGMGINIPDIRRTIHFHLPSSIENLVQESGRAARDGNESTCYIFIDKMESNFYRVLKEESFKVESLKKISNLPPNLFLFSTNKYDYEQESQMIFTLFKNINIKEEIKVLYSEELRTILNLDKDKNKDNTLIESLLYKLYLLGIIDIWDMNYNRGISNVEYTIRTINSTNIEKMIYNLEKYISSYELNFKYTYKKDIYNIIKFLCYWSFNRFTKNSINSLYNIYKYCSDDNYIRDTDKFKKDINEYIKVDPDIRDMFFNEFEIEEWFKIFEKYEVGTIINKLERFNEEYDNLISTRYIITLCYIIKEYEFKDELNNCFDKFSSNYNVSKQKLIFCKSYEILKDSKYLEDFIDRFCFYIKTYEVLLYVYSISKSNLAYNYLLKGFLRDIKKIGENYNGKFKRN